MERGRIAGSHDGGWGLTAGWAQCCQEGNTLRKVLLSVLMYDEGILYVNSSQISWEDMYVE